MVFTSFYAWASIAVLFFLLEIGHPGLFFYLSFAGGALLTGLLAHYVALTLVGQLFAFLGASLATFALLRVCLRRSHLLAGAVHQTNVYAIVGKHGIVIKPITATESGTVKVAGQVWSARSSHEASLPSGVEIEVVHVLGVHVVVKSIAAKNKETKIEEVKN